MSRDLNEYAAVAQPPFNTDAYQWQDSEAPVGNDVVLQMEAVEIMDEMYDEEAERR